MDTTSADGAACACCGDDAECEATVVEDSRLIDRPFCNDCYEDAIAACPECLNRFWQRDGYRIGRELLCGDCGSRHPVVVGPVMSAILADARGNK